MAILGWLRDWWRRGGRPPTRLTAEEARAIANAAMTGEWSGFAGQMGVVQVERRDDTLLWHVRSTTIGSGVSATIDDATGALLERRRWGIR
jgi:hypothetical protein